MLDEFNETSTPTTFYHQFDAQFNTDAFLDDTGAGSRQFLYGAFGHAYMSSGKGADAAYFNFAKANPLFPASTLASQMGLVILLDSAL